MGFGQLVIGPPGSGKTTYCDGICQFLNSIGRETVIVNLDPGNDLLPYECAVDVMELISLEDVMNEFELGPNGGLIYCMEYLEKNLDWLHEQLQSKCKDKYVLFDLPGQVELFTHHHAIRDLANNINEWGWKVCCVQLLDSHHCSDGSKFVSASLVALSAMTMLELPHVNVLSKMDLIQSLGPLDFNLDFYTQSLDLTRMPQLLEEREEGEAEKYGRGEQAERRGGGGEGGGGEGGGGEGGGGEGGAGGGQQKPGNKLRRLEKAIAEMVNDYQLLHFVPLSIHDKDTVAFVCRFVDKANGYLYSGDKAQVDGDTQGLGRALEADDIMDLMEERYLFDPNDPYGDKALGSSSDDELEVGEHTLS